MAALGEYIFSVSAAALMGGIVTGILKESGAVKAMKLICNLVLMVTVLQPVVKWNFQSVGDIPLPEFPDSWAAVSQGETSSHNALAAIIKQEAEAYILDKAALLGAAITVEVILSTDDPPVPFSVEITGRVSPYVKLQLEELIQEDLNIAKENQLWTG